MNLASRSYLSITFTANLSNLSTIFRMFVSLNGFLLFSNMGTTHCWMSMSCNVIKNDLKIKMRSITYFY